VADRSMLSQDTHVSDLPRARTRLLIPAADAGILPPFSAARFECSCLQTSLFCGHDPPAARRMSLSSSEKLGDSPTATAQGASDNDRT